RDIAKLVAMALEEGLPGPWDEMRHRCLELAIPLRRVAGVGTLEDLAETHGALAADVRTLLAEVLSTQDMTGNAGDFDRHQSNSKSHDDPDLEPASKEKGGHVQSDPPERKQADVYPLGMVMEACPDVRDYAPAGEVRSWSDFRDAVRTIRPMIGISPDAWREAQEALGEIDAHVVVATILQRSIHSSEAETMPGGAPGALMVNGSPAIQSPGGYLRALTAKARAGAFSLGPVLMALIGQRLKARRTAKAAG
ncbi:MAG: plasmid replication protein RepC, partial [Beijerinckiaceae bacterium]